MGERSEHERRHPFGELLRRHRRSANLTQEALALRCGLSVDAISLLERGQRRVPRRSTLVLLASSLRLAPEDREAFMSSADPLESPAAGQYLGVPRELPRSAADFVGREEELSSLTRALSAAAGVPSGVGPVVICALNGMAGVGKSALAIHLAHRLAMGGAFPDGQLYVNLRGASPGIAPLEPREALGRMLRSLGLGPTAVPTTADEAAARFRTLTADRRHLVLLDNARSAEQVQPLLPGSPSSVVLITTRSALTTLEGIHILHVDVLRHAHALELLAQIAGRERLAAEPDAAAEVVRRCGRLPLAIRIAGARLAALPGWPVRELAAALSGATSDLAALETGDLAVRAAFDVSLRTLQYSRDPVDREAAAAFGRLGTLDGPDLDAPQAAFMLDRSSAEAEEVLERLVDAHLLESPQPGRYQFHDLMHAYARGAGEAFDLPTPTE